MYDPSTVAFDIKYPWKAGSERFSYRPSFITIWHEDPEKPGTGNRTDDSCGWFDRTPGPFADAVSYVLKDKSFMHDVGLTLKRRKRVPYPFYEGISEEQLYGNRLSAGDAFALVVMIASELELRRWWNGQNGKRGACEDVWLKTFTRKRSVTDFAAGLALHPLDNLSHVEAAESMVRLTAAALNRHFRPWYRHPRWHVWHWRLQIHPLQQLARVLFDRCATCGKGFRWGYSPTSTSWEGKELHHGECLGIGVACAPTPTSISEEGKA